MIKRCLDAQAVGDDIRRGIHFRIPLRSPQNRLVEDQTLATARSGFEFINRTRSIQWALVKSDRPPLPED